MEKHTKKHCFDLKCMRWALHACGYVSEGGHRLVSSTMTQSLIPPMSDVSQLHFWPIFQPISQQLCLSLIALSSSSSPLSVSISEFNKQTDALESSFTKDVTFQTSRCLFSNHSLLSYCVLQVDNLWSSSWGIYISDLFFWSIFLLQRHGTLM